MSIKLKIGGSKSSKGIVVLIDDDPDVLYKVEVENSHHANFRHESNLVHSVILDEHYTKSLDIQKQRLNLDSRRRGRNIEVILDTPLFIDDFKDMPFYVVTFKGAGAIPEDGSSEKYVIDPLNWRTESDFPLAQFGRIWGGVDLGFAMGEAKNNILSERNIFHTPYVALNQIPSKIQDNIYQSSGRKRKDNDSDLYQIVRLSMTNIRYEDFCEFNDNEIKQFAEHSVNAGWTLDKWAYHLGSVDGVLVLESLKLSAEGRFVHFFPKGILRDNRFISGEITDLEQVTIGRYGERMEIGPWPISIMRQSKDFLKKTAMALKTDPIKTIDKYFEIISDISGHTFTGGGNYEVDEYNGHNHVDEYFRYMSD